MGKGPKSRVMFVESSHVIKVSEQARSCVTATVGSAAWESQKHRQQTACSSR